MNLLVLSVVLFLTLTLINGQTSVPYQVSIRLYDNFGSGNAVDSFILCTGGIVHPFFVLTTAHCMHSHIFSQGISRPLAPSMMYIVAGNFSRRPLTVKYVNGIFVHTNYNDTSYENDIALLKLEQPFDLKDNTDLKWLELPDNSTKFTNCFFSFNNVSSRDYTPPQTADIMDYWFCERKSNANFTAIQNVDYCSTYYFNDKFMCSVPENQLKSINDRGTPLICNNRLAGLLSVIIPPGNDTASTGKACNESLKTLAYYTPVVRHVKWIHSIIGVNLPTSSDGKPAPIVPDSPPYQAPTASSTIKPPKGNSATTYNLSEVTVLLAIVTWVFAHYF